jgi:hypothetical protein
VPSVVNAIYDGRRRGKTMVVIEPFSTWGSRAYGLKGGSDDFRMQPVDAKAGHRVVLTLSDRTYLRLVRDRERRSSYRGR